MTTVRKKNGENSTLSFGPVNPRPARELLAAQTALAVATLEHPELTSEGEREGALREVLDALGLFVQVEDRTEKLTDNLHGTIRGYNGHIRSYSTPCNPCIAARQRQLDARWNALGIKSGEVVLPA